MMKHKKDAQKCHICGKIFDFYDSNSISIIKLFKYEEAREYNFCEECTAKIMEQLNILKKGAYYDET